MTLPDLEPETTLPRRGSTAPINRIVGNKIKHLREMHGRTLSQEILGKRIGISKAQVWNIENGKIDIPLSRLASIASALRVPIAVLLPDNEQGQ